MAGRGWVGNGRLLRSRGLYLTGRGRPRHSARKKQTLATGREPIGWWLRRGNSRDCNHRRRGRQAARFLRPVLRPENHGSDELPCGRSMRAAGRRLPPGLAGRGFPPAPRAGGIWRSVDASWTCECSKLTNLRLTKQERGGSQVVETPRCQWWEIPAKPQRC